MTRKHHNHITTVQPTTPRGIETEHLQPPDNQNCFSIILAKGQNELNSLGFIKLMNTLAQKF